MEANAAKGISAGIFVLITVAMGTLPLCFVNNKIIQLKLCLSPRVKVVLSVLNCFAGGVFLGACLLNLLLNGQERFRQYTELAHVNIVFPVFEMAVGAGLFAIALVETAVHACMSRHSRRADGKRGGKKQAKLHTSAQSAINHGTAPSVIIGLEDVQTPSTANQVSEKTTNEILAEGALSEEQVSQERCTEIVQTVGAGEVATAATSQQDDEGPPEVTSGVSSLRAFLLLAALSFHTVFDGLAVGLTESASEVWSVAAGICVHKAIVAFCLGLKLSDAMPSAPLRTFLSMVVFSCMTPLGVGIGVGVTSAQEDVASEALSSSVLQAVATGAFLYVTFFDVLGPELAAHQASCIAALKILASVLGFGAMAGIKAIDRD